MKFRVLTASEQLYQHLKTQLIQRVWTDVMPGEERLLTQFGVGQGTVRAALQHLENDGLLVSEGQGRKRKIVLPENLEAPALRINILLYQPSDAQEHYHVDILHQLLKAGHAASICSKSLVELGMNLQRIDRFIQKSPADAWIVTSGTDALVEWFSKQQAPAFALAGRLRGIQIAGTGPDKKPALLEAVRKLTALGHRRITMLAREVRRKPGPGRFERAFLDELKSQDIPCGSYNLPDWDDSTEGFLNCLDTLFEHTPPTALIIDDIQMFIAAREYLAQRGILAPRDVSMICNDPNPAFNWCRPKVAHIHWESSRWSRRILQWADNIAHGKKDQRQSFTQAKFIEGGTIGPIA